MRVAVMYAPGRVRPTSHKASSMMTKVNLTSGLMVELRRLEPLTSSMPSALCPCGRQALRLTIGHPRPPLTATVRADW